MTIGSLFKKNKSKISESSSKVNDVLTERFRATLLADYKNESTKSKYPEVDGHDILGVLSGIFFIPDGKSVNERFYPREFWESVLANPEVQNRIEDRLMFGTIGHEDKYVDDADLACGKISHIVTKLWIDEEGLGRGEALILGTDAGKNLYRLLKAKSKIKISSRAYGDYIQGAFHEGMPIMDADSYRLEGFDVVLFPGFPQTQLALNESAEHNDIDNKLIIESVIKRRSESMAGKNTKKVNSEASLAAELRRSRAKAESEIVVKDKKLAAIQEELNAVTKERDQWKEEGSKLLASYKRYNSLGTVNELKSKLEKLEAFEAIAENPEEIKSAIVEATDRINKGKELFAMLEDAGSALDMTESALNQYMELVGTVSEARRNKIRTERALKQYTSFGTISDVAAMYEKCKNAEKELQQNKLEKDCRKYSALTGQSIETVEKVFETAKSREDAINILSSLKSTVKNEKANKLSFKKESVIDSKNNKVLETKHESVEENSDIAVSKAILRKSMKF